MFLLCPGTQAELCQVWFVGTHIDLQMANGSFLNLTLPTTVVEHNHILSEIPTSDLSDSLQMHNGYIGEDDLRIDNLEVIIDSYNLKCPGRLWYDSSIA